MYVIFDIIGYKQVKYEKDNDYVTFDFAVSMMYDNRYFKNGKL